MQLMKWTFWPDRSPKLKLLCTQLTLGDVPASAWRKELLRPLHCRSCCDIHQELDCSPAARQSHRLPLLGPCRVRRAHLLLSIPIFSHLRVAQAHLRIEYKCSSMAASSPVPRLAVLTPEIHHSSTHISTAVAPSVLSTAIHRQRMKPLVRVSWRSQCPRPLS